MKKKKSDNKFSWIILIVILILIIFVGVVILLNKNNNLRHSPILGVDLAFDKNIPWGDVVWSKYPATLIVVNYNNVPDYGNGYNVWLKGAPVSSVSSTIYYGEEWSFNANYNYISNNDPIQKYYMEIKDGNVLLAKVSAYCEFKVNGKAYTTIERKIGGKMEKITKATKGQYCSRDLFAQGNKMFVKITNNVDDGKIKLNVMNTNYLIDGIEDRNLALTFSFTKNPKVYQYFYLRNFNINVLDNAKHSRYSGKEVITYKNDQMLNALTVYIINLGTEMIEKKQDIYVDATISGENSIKRFRGSVSSDNLIVGKKVAVILYPLDEASKSLLRYEPGSYYTTNFHISGGKYFDDSDETNENNNDKTIFMCVGDCFREINDITRCEETDDGYGDIDKKGTVSLIDSKGNKVDKGTDYCQGDDLIEYSCTPFGNYQYQDGVWYGKPRHPVSTPQSNPPIIWRCSDGKYVVSAK